MNIPQGLFLISGLVFELVGIIVFMRGFLPMKAAVPGFASLDGQTYEPRLSAHVDQNHSSSELDSLYGRLVLVLIDALRADFVLPADSDLPRLKFVEKLVQNRETQSFLAKARPPTVTMPRIKAISTGGIPGFVDVVLNFDSAALQEDNLIGQLYRADKKMIFYGDDTWMKLFPGHFLRTDGTTSFFVTDYTEVDTNVTRHLDEELTSDDWDVMILHYLGLDHIGHLAGPRSPLVPGKLDEMDGIMKILYDNIIKQDRIREKPTLLILCGDHGMSDQGSHGGATPSETTTPLVFISSLFGSGKGSTFEGIEIEQTDLAPSLALLLGVPIPQNSLGVVIPHVLSGHTTRDKLKALYANSQQIVNVFKKNVPNFDKDQNYLSLKRAVKMHEAWLEMHLSGNLSVDEMRLGNKVIEKYVQVLHSMRDKVASSLTKYDLYAMCVGIVLLWMLLVSVFYGCFSGSAVKLSLGWKGTFILVLVLHEVFSMHTVRCTDSPGSPFLCGDDRIGNVFVVLLIPWCSVWITLTIVEFWPLVRVLWNIEMGRMIKTHSSGSILLVIGTVFHTLTLLASSFVEEEHQTWYFLTVSFHLLLWISFTVKAFYLTWHGGTNLRRPFDNTVKVENYVQLEDVQLLNSWHQKVYRRPTNSEDRVHVDETEKVTSHEYSSFDTDKDSVIFSEHHDVRKDENTQSCTRYSGYFVFNIIRSCIRGSDNMKPTRQEVFWLCSVNSGAVLLLCRVLRAWNQTGDKWSHLPDVGDWLVRPDNRVYLTMATMLALAISCLMLGQGRDKFSQVLILAVTVLIYCFRAANGTVLLPWIYAGESSKGVLEAQMVYWLILILLVVCLSKFMLTFLKKQPLEKDSQNTSAKSPNEDLSYMLVPFLKGLQTTWALFYLLLMRPHNISMAVMVIAQERFMRQVVRHYRFNTPAVALLYMWMGQASFYFQGNSNSIATVDVSAGYIGLENYNPVLIGLLMCLATYAGPLFWIFSLLVHVADVIWIQHNKHKFRHDILHVVYTLLLSRAFPVAVYTVLVTLQRYHLFVWSVFSPKLLYEAMYTLVISIVCCLLLGLRSL